MIIGSAKLLELLEFNIEINPNTGEEDLSKKRSVYIDNIIFTLTPKIIKDNQGNWREVIPIAKCQGSLHKFANEGVHNFDRFTYAKYLKAADQLRKYINQDDIINVIEFGVNIITPFDPSDLITNLISYRKKQFNKTIKPTEVSARVEYEHFIIKLYNKGLHQGPREENILRFEIKYLKMQKPFPNGLRWGELALIDTWVYLGNILRKKFADILYYDPTIDFKEMPIKDSNLIGQGHNPVFWEKLSGPHASRKRRQYQDLIWKHGSLFKNLPDLLDQEISELVKSYHFSDQVKGTERKDGIDEMVNCYPLLSGNLSPTKNCKILRNNFCRVTGVDISMQKNDSKFLNITGLLYLHKNIPDQFEKLKNGRLSPKWNKEPYNVQLREIAHSIRNEYYNPKHNAKRDILKVLSYPSLFDNLSLIKESKLLLVKDQDER